MTSRLVPPRGLAVKASRSAGALLDGNHGEERMETEEERGDGGVKGSSLLAAGSNARRKGYIYSSSLFRGTLFLVIFYIYAFG